ncbi:hypothetical protein FGO68_gene1288 [Halteria grandinella]|uniref:Uncharacterized protein n=1 Tax=Halteria grandinella TaxID=5974 RepID=A0A8J8NLS0_HALGN|nr:hypothetical protein FGO68_gene1288 [Halteria grandinella]
MTQRASPLAQQGKLGRLRSLIQSGGPHSSLYIKPQQEGSSSLLSVKCQIMPLAITIHGSLSAISSKAY